MELEQCESCLGYTKKGLKQLCSECEDKAASFDIITLERTYLLMAAEDCIERAKETDITSIAELQRLCGFVMGRLQLQIDFCKPTTIRITGEKSPCQS